MTPVVVIGDHTQGLGIVRSAAAVGAAVWVVNDKHLSLARFSRHLAGYRRLRRGILGQLDHPQCSAYLREALLDIPLPGRAALLGVNEDITRFLHQNREALLGRFFIPETRLELIYDKHLFNQFLPEAARIETRLCSETDLAALKRPHRYLLKGRTGNAFRQITSRKAMSLDQTTPEERRVLFGRLPADQVVVQAIVETSRPILSVCALSVEGRIRGHFGYQKLRQHPDRFGTGTYLRSAAVDTVLPVAGEILEGLNYTGISEIEFIHDAESDVYRVIEMNPRTWKSVHFATQCGQNLVAQYLQHLQGRGAGAVQSYVLDRFWADLATDLPQSLREGRFPRYDRGFYECTWDASDPWPAIVLWTLFPLLFIEESLPRTPPPCEGKAMVAMAS